MNLKIKFILNYPEKNYKNTEYLGERAKLAPTNEIVDMLNNIILNDIPGEK